MDTRYGLSKHGVNHHILDAKGRPICRNPKVTILDETITDGKTFGKAVVTGVCWNCQDRQRRDRAIAAGKRVPHAYAVRRY